MFPCKAVIFDLDGTLLNTLDDLHDAVNESLESFQYPLRSQEEIRQFVGNGMLRLIEDSLPPELRHKEKIVFQCMHKLGEIYSRIWNRKSHLYHDMPLLLDKLSLARIPMGILSNKPHPFTLEVCHYFLKKWDFCFTIGGREHLPLKPNPELAFEALEHFRRMHPLLQAEEVLFVGDGDADIKTALAADMQPLAVLWGFRDKEQLQAVGAKNFAVSPLDILDYLSI